MLDGLTKISILKKGGTSKSSTMKKGAKKRLVNRSEVKSINSDSGGTKMCFYEVESNKQEGKRKDLSSNTGKSCVPGRDPRFEGKRILGGALGLSELGCHTGASLE